MIPNASTPVYCLQVCTGFKAWSSAQGKAKKKPAFAATAAATAGAVASTSTPSASASTAQLAVTQTGDVEPERKDCPADVERLGRHTWTFLHTAASYFPTVPTLLQQSSMLSLLNSMPVLYPCSHCAGELGDYMKLHPPTEAVKERTALERWLCEVHNDVNHKLGKEEFNCDKAGERWRDGPADGSCD